MLLSFVIPTYNVGGKIEMCLTSISRISLSKDDYEVIIIDDSSTDNTIHEAEEFLIKNMLSYTKPLQEIKELRFLKGNIYGWLTRMMK